MNNGKKEDMLGYLPPYLRQYQELQQMIGIEATELEDVEKWHQQSIDDRFVVSCGKAGIEKFEKMLGIVPYADDSMETRRFRILSKWNTAASYHYAFLAQQLQMLCGENGYRLRLDFERQILEVKVNLLSKNMVTAVKDMVAAIVPCNMITAVSLLYNTHKMLGRYTHGQLSGYTHKQLREDVITGWK